MVHCDGVRTARQRCQFVAGATHVANQADRVRRSVRSGGNTDTLARLLNQKLADALGQPVVIENKPGAGGNIGSDFVAKAKPDGYTILGGTISSHAINASVYPNMPYDAVKSFEPVISSAATARVRRQREHAVQVAEGGARRR
jgi:tripartite-type tricarboxylate transporter receptor subunit TctC